jgi:stage II sporulation protein GA (sporulation sigma-E factor processing peptidase)
MILTTFGFKNILSFFKNLFYLYIASIFLGGTLYFLNLQFSYKNNGLIFYHSGLSINIILIIILTPIIIYLYLKQATNQKNTSSNYYKVDIYLTSKTIIHTTAFLDTGNNLKDPYKSRPIILLNKDLVKRKYKYLLVPYNSLNNHSLLKCIIPKKIIIEGHPEQTNFLVGLAEEKILIEGAECILNKKLLERMN